MRQMASKRQVARLFRQRLPAGLDIAIAGIAGALRRQRLRARRGYPKDRRKSGKGDQGNDTWHGSGFLVIVARSRRYAVT